MEAAETKARVYGASLDYAECFDRICSNTGIGILELWGIHPRIAMGLKGIYHMMRRCVQVNGVTKGTFRASDGIFHGCALSGCIITGLMATWTLAIKRDLGTEFCLGFCVTFSIYLDDRNFLASHPRAIVHIIQQSGRFDDLIMASLNVSKTQIYAAQEADMQELNAHFPDATIQRRPWSLGCALPTGFDIHADPQARDKLQARYDTTCVIMKKAVCLPYNTRVMVGPAYIYGIEHQPPSANHHRAICETLYQTIVPRRPSGSRLIFWTCILKGLSFNPIALQLRETVRFFRTLWLSDHCLDFFTAWINPRPRHRSITSKSSSTAWGGSGRNR